MTEIYLLHCTRAYRLTEKILILRVNYIIPYSHITNFKRSLKVKLAKMVLPGFNTKGQNKTNKLADIYKVASTNMGFFPPLSFIFLRGRAVQARQPAGDCALRRTHFSARMPGAHVLLLVQHVTTSVGRRWQRATEQGQG